MSHLGGAYPGGDVHTYWPDIWGWILVEMDVRSVLDIGCGYGHNLKWFKDQGCDVLGVEGDPEAVEQHVLPLEVILHDYTTGPYIPDRVFDLCICTEFVEHVDAQYEDNWFATMSVCKYVLMCHAVPGQGGYHHVNEQTEEYWIDKFRNHWFSERFRDTYLFRKTINRKPTPWGRNTVMFFEQV